MIELRRGRKRTLPPSRKYSRGLLREKELSASRIICRSLTCCSGPAALVTFLIGPGDNPEKFLVHKEVACYHSKVFDAAFNNTAFVEGQTQTYKMDDTSVRAFRLLAQWLYFKKLEIAQLKEDWRKDITVAGAENQSLAELWVLADKLGISELQNVTIESMHKIQVAVNRVPVQSFKYIYNNTSQASPLRRYVVELSAIRLNTECFSKFSDQFPHGILIDIVTFYSTRHWALKDSNKNINISDYRVPDDIDGTA